ncbi:MAG: 3'(2'),5'-bisphosphate nucleotidase [Alphaproteobacteria bacterium]|nr:3'(2'),5'-bisphosphate nucleotidase [Alphaproteobacteria bacterium]
MEPHDCARLLDPLTKIVREAGRLILEIYERTPNVRQKADRTPVTDADERAEAVIVAALESLTPHIPIIAEERMARGLSPAIEGGQFWLVDPLDGTREFLNRNGEFTVNIALIETSRPTIGIVHLPAKGSLYATDGALAYREDADGARRLIRARAAPASGVTVVASRSHNSPETKAYVEKLLVATYREAGSSLKFCVIAEGEADLYPRFGRTMEWDTAAGDAVLTAAGGRVTTLDDQPLLYGKPGFANPVFLARGVTG